jgi:hypothetical protein
MITWIASYPKSGNTWVRSFLTSYLYGNENFNLDDIKKIGKFPSLKLFKELKIDYKSFENIAANWITMQDFINLKNKIVYLKTHNALVTLDKYKFTDTNNTIGFIYLVRDPRDVVLSYSSHLGLDPKDTFMLMQNDLSFEPIKNDIDHKGVMLASWASHYNSWKSFKSVKGLILRYEDLVLDTENSFLKIIKHLNEINNIKIDFNKIKKSLEVTNFKKLKDLETTEGFSEAGNNPFFRKGKIGDWKDNLEPEITKQIEKVFNKEMKELKYL